MVKENNGSARRKRWLLTGIAALTCLLFFIYFIVRRIKPSRAKVIPAKASNELVDNKFMFDSRHPEERAVLEAKYFLIDIKVAYNSLREGQGKSYHSVTGTFCPLDWRLHKTNPSQYPMFRELVKQSKHCTPNKVTLDLREITKKARLYDSKKPGVVKPLPISGVAFHETRCGSTLVANLLAAMKPEKHRVYSESTPPAVALRSCDNDNACDPAKQDMLLKDVFYMMGRSSNPKETNVFYKFQSVTVKSIHAFTRNFPQIPWVFVYRDSVEIMMSHLGKHLDETERAVCLRAMNNPPPDTKRIIREQGYAPSDLSAVQHCAAHLASLCQSAIDEYISSPEKGKFVNYRALPDTMWETILPKHFDLDVGDKEIENMKTVSQVYSKGFRGESEWKDDTQQKQDRATDKIKEASDLFLGPRYDKMESFNDEEGAATEKPEDEDR